MKTTPSYIDIFSGCGGLSLGLLNAGWNGLFALEKSPEAFSTLQHNLINNQTHFLWPSWLEIKNWDINEVLTSKETELKNLQGHVDLLVGGPPCQGFSTAGKRNILDPRNKLIHSYIKFVKLTKPSILLFENVSGFTYTMKDDKSNCEINFANTVVEKLKELGYTDAKGEMVNFSDYGIPQKRKRYLVIATLNNNSKVIFEELKSNKISFLRTKKLNSFTTVTDAISDLEKNTA